MAAMHTSSNAKNRQRAGLLLLLAGVVLAAGGFALPWLSVTCVAHCSYGSWAPTRGPIETDGLFLFICWPVWLVVFVSALLTALQEFRPAERRSVVPVLLLAGMLLVVQAVAFLLLDFNVSRPALPILTYGLLPGVTVAPVGALLVGVGGWLRHHPRRIATSPILAEVPAER